jgi:Outer membrane protein beta-barrel domain
MIKRLLFFVITATICIPAFEQSAKVLHYQIVDMRRLHFGFTIGLNTFDYNFLRRVPGDPRFAQVIGLEPGFNVNIVSELRLNENFALRFLPGLVFGQRRVSLLIPPKYSVQTFTEVESNYIDVPILIKYKGKRQYNYRPYLIGGLSFRYDMAARKNPKFDIPVGGQELSVNMKPFDTYLECGFGMDYYLTYFKLSTEIKLSLGIRNILDSNLVPAGINGFTSQIVLINFHFE